MTELFRPDRIERRIRAQALHRIFWQGENAIDGLRTDVCPLVAEYYETDTINQLKATKLCYITREIRLNTILPVCAELLSVAVVTLTRLLYHSNPSRSASYRGNWRFI